MKYKSKVTILYSRESVFILFRTAVFLFLSCFCFFCFFFLRHYPINAFNGVTHARSTLAHHKSDGSPAGNDALGCRSRERTDLYIASYWIFMRAYPLAMDLCLVLSRVIMSRVSVGKLHSQSFHSCYQISLALS